MYGLENTLIALVILAAIIGVFNYLLPSSPAFWNTIKYVVNVIAGVIAAIWVIHLLIALIHT